MDDIACFVLFLFADVLILKSSLRLLSLISVWVQKASILKTSVKSDSTTRDKNQITK